MEVAPRPSRTTPEQEGWPLACDAKEAGGKAISDAVQVEGLLDETAIGRDEIVTAPSGGVAAGGHTPEDRSPRTKMSANLEMSDAGRASEASEPDERSQDGSDSDLSPGSEYVEPDPESLYDSDGPSPDREAVKLQLEVGADEEEEAHP